MNNLQMYHKLFYRICQLFPKERITRQRNLALVLVGLYKGASVHLSHIAREMPVQGKLPSVVNRVRRFLNNPRIDVREWYRPVAKEILDTFADRHLYLIIDCTKIGFHYRLMCVALAYRKRSLPLAWHVYRGGKGHTTAQEQIKLFREVKRLLSRSRHRHVTVLGDAGFQSIDLLRWLARQHWRLVIRQPGNNQVRWAGQNWIKLNAIPLEKGQTRSIGWVRLTRKHDAGWFWLVLHWEIGEEEPWFLVSDQPGEKRIIRLYRMRMWIEEMYGDMKGHGFDLEATHLDDVDRISRLVMLVCFSFVWLITLGAWVVKRGYRHLIDIKSRRDKSYFRLGWDWLARCLLFDIPFYLRFKPIL